MHSALCRHAITNNHTPNWKIEDINVLAKFNPSFDLQTKLNINEILHIKKTYNTLNYKTDIFNLPVIYNNIFGL